MLTVRFSKSKRFTFIFTLLSASNIQFVKADMRGISASVANVHMLQQVVRLLGVSPNEFAQTLSNRTKLCPQGQFM